MYWTGMALGPLAEQVLVDDGTRDGVSPWYPSKKARLELNEKEQDLSNIVCSYKNMYTKLYTCKVTKWGNS